MRTTLAFAWCLTFGCATQSGPPPSPAHSPGRGGGKKSDAPPTRVDDVVDVLHGVEVRDPYRWLEDGTKPEVAAWVEAQNGYLRSKLDGVELRKPIGDRLSELLAIGTLSTPVIRYPKSGPPRVFYTRREGSQNQPILYVREGLRGSDRVVVDPNAVRADGTAALDWWYPSDDGRLVAYGVSLDGSEWSTLRVHDLAAGKDLGDTIERTRACSLAWRPDGRGFYYTRYPRPGDVPAGEEHYYRHVFEHVLGTDPAGDPKLFGEGRDPKDWTTVGSSPDGKRLVIEAWQGWAKSEVYLLDTAKGSKPVAVAEKIDAAFDGELLDDRLLLRTNDGAPTYRLFSVDPKKPARTGWKEIVPAQEDVLDSVTVVGKKLVAETLHQAHSRLHLLDLGGKPLGEIALPTLGTVTGIGGTWDRPDLFIGFTSFAVPPEVHHRDLRSAKTELWERITAPVDTAGYQVEQVFFDSDDGTQVSMFLVHRKDLPKDGLVPTLLYGYGGFNISLTPSFNRAAFLLLERGGVYAVANLRGGGEYGDAWHKAGMLGKKQNVFDDFLAAADWLLQSGYTSPERLAIAGRSNGGLLVAAALTQRPRAFRAVLCGVPLADMLRYHRFLIAKLWIPELGSADDPEAFKWLHAYSPYHRVEDGKDYPAVLITTGEGDSRVEPSHARKLAARLQAATGSGQPVLLRTDVKAGHGQGKPLAKLVDEATDEWTFLFWQLGVRPW
jgi:prolyl oligopeptidase